MNTAEVVKGEIQGSWNQALADSESELRKARREVAQWEYIVRVCREKIKKGIPWPREQKTQATQN